MQAAQTQNAPPQQTLRPKAAQAARPQAFALAQVSRLLQPQAQVPLTQPQVQQIQQMQPQQIAKDAAKNSGVGTEQK